ncbi:MAG: universal stress protein [Myxococcales bacterium]|nr:universal stress protein [Myxococcales bacterium]
MATQQTSSKRRIVVGVDMSQTGDHAIREAMRLSRALDDGELHVTFVIATDRNPDAKKLDALDAQLTETVEKLRDHVAEVCKPGSNEAAFSAEAVFHVRLGKPAPAIHQVAVDVDADIIVVGTHGRKGVEKWILGSVAEELTRTAHVPVLVAHPKDFEGLDKSAKADPPRPGQDLKSDEGLSRRVHLEFTPRTSHISGLI